PTFSAAPGMAHSAAHTHLAGKQKSAGAKAQVPLSPEWPDESRALIQSMRAVTTEKLLETLYDKYSFKNGSSLCTRSCVDPSKTMCPSCKTRKLVFESSPPSGIGTMWF